jgi:hypothetical protein
MEITEKEREMLEKERDQIKKLTTEILELENDPKNNTKLKQNVIAIQSSISRMASYSNPEQYKLDGCAKIAENVLALLSGNPSDEVQKGMEKLIYDPPDEVLKRLKIKRDQWFTPHQNVAYPAWWSFAVDGLDKYCNYVNSIRFNFTKKGLTIVFPKIVLPKILNLNFGNITNRRK